MDLLVILSRRDAFGIRILFYVAKMLTVKRSRNGGMTFWVI